jgi:hypothetical protein
MDGFFDRHAQRKPSILEEVDRSGPVRIGCSVVEYQRAVREVFIL